MAKMMTNTRKNEENYGKNDDFQGEKPRESLILDQKGACCFFAKIVKDTNSSLVLMPWLVCPM